VAFLIGVLPRAVFTLGSSLFSNRGKLLPFLPNMVLSLFKGRRRIAPPFLFLGPCWPSLFFYNSELVEDNMYLFFFDLGFSFPVRLTCSPPSPSHNVRESYFEVGGPLPPPNGVLSAISPTPFSPFPLDDRQLWRFFPPHIWAAPLLFFLLQTTFFIYNFQPPSPPLFYALSSKMARGGNPLFRGD